MTNQDRDVFDELFDSLINESSDKYNPEDFSKIVQNKINHSENISSLSDLINENKHVKKTRTNRKPTISEDKKNLTFNNRFDYFMNDLQAVDYHGRNDGYYRNGHQDALEKYYNQANLNKSNLCSLEDIVNDEMDKYIRSNASGEYAKGYFDGLKYVKEALDRSKRKMMSEIATMLKKQL